MYVEFLQFLLDPTVVLPVIPDEFVSSGITGAARKPQGVYRDKGIELLARDVIMQGGMGGYNNFIQLVSVKGPTVAKVINFFRQFMAGELTPTEPWKTAAPAPELVPAPSDA